MLTNSRKETEKPKKTQGGALTYSSFTKTQSFVYTPEIILLFTRQRSKTGGQGDKGTHHHSFRNAFIHTFSHFEMHTFTLISFVRYT